MPELDDLGSLVPLAGANLSALDKIAVYHAATKSVREVSAVEIGSATPESVLALLADEDIVSKTLTVDHILVADQAGFDIPNFAFSRKGNVPYFGNTPLNDAQSVKFAGNLTAVGANNRVLLASIPISAADMVPQRLWLGFNINLRLSHADVDSWMIWFDFNGGTELESGLYLVLGSTTGVTAIFEGPIQLHDNGANVDLQIAVSAPVLITNTGALITDLGAQWSGIGVGGGTKNVANNINIYLQQAGATPGNTASAVGIVTISESP